ncbi:MAG: endolytic transglycosylase MltG [Sphingomonadaceae bacterium]
MAPRRWRKISRSSVASGASLGDVARALEDDGLIDSADGFLLRAKILGSSDPVRAGEFQLPAGASYATILSYLQQGSRLVRLWTIPEGMPSIMVHEH